MTKTMKNLSNQTTDELNRKAKTLEGELFQLRMQQKTGQLEKTSQVWMKRKELARVKTLLRSQSKNV